MKQYDSIKKKLGDFEAPIDTQKLWNQTQHAIPKRKRRRAILLWSMGGIGLLCTVLLSALSLKSGDPNHLTSQVRDQRAATNMDLSTRIDSNAIETNNQIHNTRSTTDRPAMSAENHSPDSMKVIRSHSQNNSSPEILSSSIPTGRNVQKNKQNSDTSPGLLSNRSIHTANDQNSDEKGTDPEKTTLIHTQPHIQLSNAAEPPSREDARTLSTTQIVSDPQRTPPLSDMIDALPIAEIPFDPSELTFDVPSNEIKKSHPSKIHIELGLSQHIGSAWMAISSTDDELGGDVQFLKDHIQSLEVLSSGGSALFQLNRGLEFGAHVQWNQMSTASGFEWTQTEVEPGTGTTEIIIDENGHTQLITGDVAIIRTRDWEATRYSQHRWTSLGASLTTPVMRSPRWHILAGVQANYILGFHSTGSYYHDDNTPYRFTSSASPFASKQKWSLGLHGKMKYQISRTWSARLELACYQFQYQLKTQPIQFDHTIWSIGMGIGYRIQ